MSAEPLIQSGACCEGWELAKAWVRPRVRALHRLTGGNPRSVLMGISESLLAVRRQFGFSEEEARAFLSLGVRRTCWCGKGSP